MAVGHFKDSFAIVARMHSGDLSKLPNPFAPEASSWNRGRLISAFKVLLVVTVAFAILMAVTSRGPTWLANRLSQDFQSLDSTEKQSRLVQLSQLGVAGFEPMMVGLVDEDPEVANQTIALIRDLQTQWTTLPRSESHKLQLALIDAIAKQGPRFPEPQQVWAANLLNQTIIENVDDSSASSQQVFAAANIALQQLTTSDAPVAELYAPVGRTTLIGQTVSLKPAPARGQSAREHAVASHQHAEPLPLRASDVESSWTDWPPQEPKILKAGFLGESMQSQPVAVAPPVTVSQASLSLPTTPDVRPAVYVETPVATAANTENTIAVDREIPPTPSPVDWENFDTASIINVLGSDQPVIRDQAAQQLRQRGFSETELSVANAIANSDAAYRTELIRQLTTQQSVDARPWLLLLLRDEDRKVKLEAVSALARFLDPQIRKELRLRMIDETDQKVVLRIRNVLQLSCLP